jgi:hypothetical protein
MNQLHQFRNTWLTNLYKPVKSCAAGLPFSLPFNKVNLFYKANRQPLYFFNRLGAATGCNTQAAGL